VDPMAVEVAWHRGGCGGAMSMWPGPSGGRIGGRCSAGVDPTVVEAVRCLGVGARVVSK
jgi:hypothetical protein